MGVNHMQTDIERRGYRLMATSRAIDDACLRLIADGVDVPNYHGARGQEAMYAGAGVPLTERDYLLYNYRAFATLLAKGVTLDELCGDLLLRANGTSRGHGGIMHVVKPEVRVVGRNGVFGSKFGMATGLGLAIRMRGEASAVLCMFGEAEGNRGTIYEALNMAVLHDLPIVFVAENNGYAVAARTRDLYAGGNMSDLVRGFPMPVSAIDGNDFVVVRSEIDEAVQRARAGGGPSYVEVLSYRVDPHHAHDDDSLYRDQHEAGFWQARDPLARLEAVLVQQGVPAGEVETIRKEADASVRAAMETATNAPLPDAAGVYDFVYFTDRQDIPQR